MTRRSLCRGASIVLLLVTIAGGSESRAQTPVPSPPPATLRLAWDHDGINTDLFKVLADGVVVTDNIPSTARAVAFPALTPGNHSLTVQACNLAGCSSSAPLLVVVVVMPAPATNLRLETVAP